jgi:prepilin-type N-terminal cleavage/methylation domain-containing protein
MTRRSGFTLIELLVALTITSIVVLLAARLFSGMITVAVEVRTTRDALDRRINAQRWEREAFANIEVGTSGAHPFEGHSGNVTFTSWMPVSDGWLERGTTRLNLVGPRLVLAHDGLPPIVLADHIAQLNLDYLLEPGLNSRWVQDWISPVSAPLAVRLRLTDSTASVDTLLFLIGERG